MKHNPFILYLIVAGIIVVILAGYWIYALKKPPESIWVGRWVREGSNNFVIGVLDIKKATGSSFSFSLNANVGGNIGEISSSDSGQERIAAIQGSTAFATIVDSAPNFINTCEVSFTLKSPSTISLKTKDCEIYAGAGVAFDGEYVKNGKIQELSLEDIITSDGKKTRVFATAAEANEFARIAGNDAKLFINSFMVVSKERDLDGLKAKVYSGFLQHVANMTGVIMTGPANKMWAAVTDFTPMAGSQNYDIIIKYFTNDLAYKDRLPKTIEYWRQNIFEGEKTKVIYNYK